MRCSTCECPSFRLCSFISRAVRLSLVLALALSIPSCNKNIDLSGIDWSMASVRLFVLNTGPSEIVVSYREGASVTIPPSSRVFIRTWIDRSAVMVPDSLLIKRDVISLALVSFRLLRFPAAKETQDTTLVISEPSPGKFSAGPAEPDWIEVISVTPLP